MKSCSWGMCSSNTRRKNDQDMLGVSFRRFPSAQGNRQRCLKWIRRCHRTHEALNIDMVGRNHYVCSKHFIKGERDPITACTRNQAPFGRRHKYLIKTSQLTPPGNTEEKDPDRNNDRNGYILFTKSRQNMEIPTAVEQVIKVSKESAKSRQTNTEVKDHGKNNERSNYLLSVKSRQMDSEGKNPVKNNEAVGDILSAESRQRMEIPTVVEQLISERDESAGSRQMDTKDPGKNNKGRAYLHSVESTQMDTEEKDSSKNEEGKGNLHSAESRQNVEIPTVIEQLIEIVEREMPSILVNQHIEVSEENTTNMPHQSMLGLFGARIETDLLLPAEKKYKTHTNKNVASKLKNSVLGLPKDDMETRPKPSHSTSKKRKRKTRADKISAVKLKNNALELPNACLEREHLPFEHRIVTQTEDTLCVPNIATLSEWTPQVPQSAPVTMSESSHAAQVFNTTTTESQLYSLAVLHCLSSSTFSSEFSAKVQCSLANALQKQEKGIMNIASTLKEVRVTDKKSKLQNETVESPKSSNLCVNDIATVGHERFSKHVQSCDEKCFHFLGIPNLATFYYLYIWLLPFIPNFKGGNGTVNSDNKSKTNRENGPVLTWLDEFILTLVKIRRGYDLEIISFLFGISKSQSYKIFIMWVNFLSECFSNLLIWPSKEVNKANLPEAFKKTPYTQAVVKCVSYIFKKPLDTLGSSRTYSPYAQQLVAIMPTGALVFLSNIYTEHLSLQAIIKASGLLDFVQNEDTIVTDGGEKIGHFLRKNQGTVNPTSNVCAVDKNFKGITPDIDINSMTGQKKEKTTAAKSIREKEVTSFEIQEETDATYGVQRSDESTLEFRKRKAAEESTIATKGKTTITKLAAGIKRRKAVTKSELVTKEKLIVEKVVRRMKSFEILNVAVPSNVVPHFGSITRIVAVLCNLQNKLA